MIRIADRKEIAEALRETRRAKGLSQRALSQRAGVPQSHIGHIERSAVFLRFPSLAAIARALDLELVLIPRGSVPAVRSIAPGAAEEPSTQDEAAQAALRDLRRLIVGASADRSRSSKHLATMSYLASTLQRLPLARADVATLIEATDAVMAFLRFRTPFKASVVLRRATALLADLRDARMHDVAAAPAPGEPPRPAHGLDGNDDA